MGLSINTASFCYIREQRRSALHSCMRNAFSFWKQQMETGDPDDECHSDNHSQRRFKKNTDIDTLTDWELAEMKYRLKKRREGEDGSV